MGNMSYCRFENTQRDMQDCLDAINNAGGVQAYVSEENPSEYEIEAIKNMIKTAKQLADRMDVDMDDIDWTSNEEEDE